MNHAKAASDESGERSICIVLHDVAPATLEQSRKVLDRLGQIGEFPVTLLAVPRYHGQPRDAAFERWLAARASQGDDVALHGFTHLDDRPVSGLIDHLRRHHYTRGEGEFSDLPEDQARQRIAAGTEWLREIGIEPAGFVAPAWLLGEAAWRALREHHFSYTCTLRDIHLLPGNATIRAQAQVYSNSAAWRRGMSVLWNASLAAWQRKQPVVRLELHPADVDHPLLARSWQRLAREQLLTRTPRTLHQLVQRFSAQAAR
ncbi:MAG: polysaccharide deacetylase family protein [Burkholderiales bacterium]